MLKVSADHGVVEVNSKGDVREVVCDLVTIVVAVHHDIEEKNPAAANVLRAMLADGECMESALKSLRTQFKRK